MIFHDCEQNTDLWFELRIAKATASNFSLFMSNEGKAFGDPAKKYAIQIALERITGQRSEQSFSGNGHTDRGTLQEPIARDLYEKEYFVDVKNGGLFCHGTYSSSPDGLVNDDGVIEIKSVLAATHYATLKRGGHDPAYTWQLVGHMDCTQRDYVDFISYCAEFPRAKQLIVHRLHRDDYLDHIKRLTDRRNEFLKLVDEVQKTILEAA